MRSLIFLACIFCSLQLSASKLPDNLLLVGFDGESWYPYLVVDSQWKKITDIRDPAYLTWHPSNKTFYIKGDDGDLYHHVLGANKQKKISLGLSKNEKNFTQLRSHADGVVMVHLIGGKSRDTELMSLDAVGNTNSVLRQSSAQFHPMIHQDFLYYAHVSCRTECEPIIQDIWRKNLLTGRAEQITKWNATTYLNTLFNHKKLTSDEALGVAVSNMEGFYNLYSVNLESGEFIPLTQGLFTDSFPALTRDNDLYFIRRDVSGTHLRYVPARYVTTDKAINEERMDTIALPKEIKKIRYLELPLQ